MRTMSLSGMNLGNLQVMPHSVIGGCWIDKHCFSRLLNGKGILDILHEQRDLIYGRPPMSNAYLFLRE